MHAFRTEAAPLSDPIVSAVRWNWKRRRLYSGCAISRGSSRPVC